MQASEVERDATNAILSKKVDVKGTLQYDTTSRNKIDGEWHAIIFKFPSGEEFVLRPIYFAYEDRQQIVNLLMETYTRLSVPATVSKGNEVTPRQLWENTDSLMTDSVTKNLKIEDGIAAALKSTHIPMHLLCKSHNVEKLDSGNLEVFRKVEESVKQQQILEK